jgi:Predicted membrane protein
MDGFYILLLYLELINLAAFIMMGSDKHRAKVHRERIPEAVLLTAAVAGGSIGAIAGMLLFRHKTHKPQFSVGLPVILGMQVLFSLMLFFAVSYKK